MKLLRATALLGALSITSIGHAATVTLPQASGGSLSATVSGVGADAWAMTDQTKSVDLPEGASWTSDSEIWKLPSDEFPIDPATGNVMDPCQNACSPYYGGVIGTPVSLGAPGWQTTPFWVVFDPHTGVAPWTNQAILSFEKAQSSVSLLWGSPDRTNMLELLLGTSVVGTFWGSEFDWFQQGIVEEPGRSAALLSLSGINFDKLRFSAWSQGGSFEFSNITSIAAVPVPAPFLMLLGALGALGLFRRKRSSGPSIGMNSASPIIG